MKDYVKILRRRLWMIMAIVVIACTATAVYSYYFIEPIYQASTKLIVNKKSELAEQLDLNSVNLNLRLIDTYKEVIKTNAIMDKVVEDHPEFGLTSEQLISRVRISSVNNTQVMTLSVQDSSYTQAVNIVNAVAKVFVEEIPKLMSVDNVSILNEAKMIDQPKPVKPNPKLNIAISFVVALMLGLGLAFLLEYLDDTVKTEQDVRDILDLPTIAIIPKVKKKEAENYASKYSAKAGEN